MPRPAYAGLLGFAHVPFMVFNFYFSGTCPLQVFAVNIQVVTASVKIFYYSLHYIAVFGVELPFILILGFSACFYQYNSSAPDYKIVFHMLYQLASETFAMNVHVNVYPV